MTSLLTSMSSLMIPMTSTCLIKFKMGTCHGSIWHLPSNWHILKILGISAKLNDILDKLDTILDDPYDRYLSWTWTLIASTSIIVYFLLNVQLQFNSHQNVVICYKGRNQNGSYPRSCSRQVPNMFKMTKIWSPITNGMPNYTYDPNLWLPAQYHDFYPPHHHWSGEA